MVREKKKKRRRSSDQYGWVSQSSASYKTGTATTTSVDVARRPGESDKDLEKRRKKKLYDAERRKRLKEEKHASRLPGGSPAARFDTKSPATEAGWLDASTTGQNSGTAAPSMALPGNAAETSIISPELVGSHTDPSRSGASQPRVKGVSKMPNGRWRARIGIGGQTTSLGIYDTAEEAAEACERARRRQEGQQPPPREKLPKGVTLQVSGRWKAQPYIRGKCVYLGTFDTMEEAVMRCEQAIRDTPPEGTTESSGALPPTSATPNPPTAATTATPKTLPKGVSFVKKSGRWQAQPYIRGKGVYLGTFDTLEEAARACEQAMRDPPAETSKSASTETTPAKPTNHLKKSSYPRGVNLTASGRWQAQLCFKGKTFYLGMHDTMEEASRAVETARAKKLASTEAAATPTKSSAATGGANRSSPNGTSPYPRGVCLTASGRWQAQLYLNGKSFYLGTHDTMEEASRAVETCRAEKLANGAAHGNSPNRTSPYPRGVSFRRGRWQAQLYFQGKFIYLGTHDTMEEASEAVEMARANISITSRKPREAIGIGTRICRPFFVDEEQGLEEWFEGKVTGYDEDLKVYRIEYEDGDAEDVDEHDLRALVELRILRNKETREEKPKPAAAGDPAAAVTTATATTVRPPTTTSGGTSTYVKNPYIEAPDIGPGWVYKQYKANKTFWSPSRMFQLRSRSLADAFQEAMIKFQGDETRAYRYLQENGRGATIKQVLRFPGDGSKDKPLKQPPPRSHRVATSYINAAPGSDEAWEENFALLVAFKERHQTTRVPYRYPALGLWASKQRKEYRERTMPSYRIQRLDSIGFVWEADKNQTRAEQKEGCAIKQEMDRMMRQQASSSSSAQRVLQQISSGSSAQRGGLTKQETRVNMGSIDMSIEEDYIRTVSESKRSAWEKKFRLLVAFRKRHGTTRVPRNHPELGQWTHHQRRNYYERKMCPYRIHCLKSIGFNWWGKKNSRRAEIELQRELLGDSTESEEEDDSSYIARALARNTNNQVDHRTDEATDMDIEVDDTNCTEAQRAYWERHFQLLVEYKNEHGTTRVPRRDPILGNWTHSQRRCYRENRLSEYRTNSLNSIGFWWNSNRDQAAGPIVKIEADHQAQGPAAESVTNGLERNNSGMPQFLLESISNGLEESWSGGVLKDSQNDNSQSPPKGPVLESVVKSVVKSVIESMVESVSKRLEESSCVGTLEDSQNGMRKNPPKPIPESLVRTDFALEPVVEI